MSKSKFKNELKDIWEEIKNPNFATMTYRELKRIRKNIKNIPNTPNPIRRGFKYTAWTLLAPIIIPTAIAMDITAVGLLIALSPILIIREIFLLTVAAASDTVRFINDLISRFDEVPAPIQTGEKYHASKPNIDSQGLILNRLNVSQTKNSAKFSSNMKEIERLNVKGKKKKTLEVPEISEASETSEASEMLSATHKFSRT